MNHLTMGATMTQEIDQVRSLVSFGKLGVGLAGARILSILSLLGVYGVGAAVVFYPTWHAVCVCAILAVVAISAHRGESRFNASESPQ